MGGQPVNVKLKTLVDARQAIQSLLQDHQELMLKLLKTDMNQYNERYRKYREIRDQALVCEVHLNIAMVDVLNQQVEVTNE
jgi:hypothetical protein